MTIPDNKNHGDAGDNGPVTVIVTRKAKKERIKEFEEWMDGVVHEAMKFEGHMGVNIIRPSDPSTNPEYVIIFRFNSYDNLAKWENSEIRNQWLMKSKDLTEGEPLVEKQTGLEFWFTPRSSGAVAPAPPRYKMAIVVTAIIFVLINTLIPLIRQVTAELPVLVSTLVGTAIMVLLMTYVVMPSVTRALRPWLSKKGLL
jgi:antibiotic biosynthesis monooxygenase (ABM) superfamily enzyme